MEVYFHLNSCIHLVNNAKGLSHSSTIKSQNIREAAGAKDNAYQYQKLSFLQVAVLTKKLRLRTKKQHSSLAINSILTPGQIMIVQNAQLRGKVRTRDRLENISLAPSLFLTVELRRAGLPGERDRCVEWRWKSIRRGLSESARKVILSSLSQCSTISEEASFYLFLFYSVGICLGERTTEHKHGKIDNPGYIARIMATHTLPLAKFHSV